MPGQIIKEYLRLTNIGILGKLCLFHMLQVHKTVMELPSVQIPSNIAVINIKEGPLSLRLWKYYVYSYDKNILPFDPFRFEFTANFYFQKLTDQLIVVIMCGGRSFSALYRDRRHEGFA